MIVATLIMSIAVVGLLSGISGATRNASKVRDYDRMVQLARLELNELLVNPAQLNGNFDRSMTGGMDAGWEAKVEPLVVPPGPGPGQFALDRILLQVWWDSGQQKRSFTLEGFRERALATEGMQ
jgi:hypothetical protein